ncbi:hypothetical protein LQF12_07450 [Ruania suaedae]|uniref:HGxxPAAW family protein n=1 Tax=Ruania suaedae TaxID=2897774 RepID=UPI001E626563|nr:HGxxPAAW family protein [Ruania suaedae]UFU04399.1 hypothetical protein LQF12_07450 [Ruania suaedae]
MTTSGHPGAAQSAAVTGPADRIRPLASPPQNHGRTVAAWAFFWGGVIAATLAGVGVVLVSVPLMVGGGAALVVGAVVSLCLRAVGLGQVRRSR